jgi:hypothetical protein
VLCHGGAVASSGKTGSRLTVGWLVNVVADSVSAPRGGVGLPGFRAIVIPA